MHGCLARHRAPCLCHQHLHSRTAHVSLRLTCQMHIYAGKAAVYVLRCGRMLEAARYASELLLRGLHAPAQPIFRLHLCRLFLPRLRQGQLMASWCMAC